MCLRPTYQRRQPEQTVLYRTIAVHLPAFLARSAGEDGSGGWPAFVRRVVEEVEMERVPSRGPRQAHLAGFDLHANSTTAF